MAFDLATAKPAFDLATAQPVMSPQANPQQRPTIDEPNIFERFLAKYAPSLPPRLESNLRGFAMGAADPSVGAAQLVANGVGALVDRPTITGNNGGIANTVNSAIAQKEAEYEAGRKAAGRDGFDASRLVGGIASPANVVVASRFAPAATTAARAVQGAEVGAIGGLTAPVTSGNDYGMQKAIQTGVGTVAGSVLTPVLGKLVDYVGQRVTKMLTDPAVAAGKARLQADDVMNAAMKEMGQSFNDIDPTVLAMIRQKVVESLKTGKQLDAAAMLRKSDFDALGLPALKGQITRDSSIFANEKNLRGVAGVGEPLQNVFDRQTQGLQERIGAYAQGAAENYQAGAQISGALNKADEALRSKVSALYNAARQSAGKDMDVPLTGLAQDVADVANRFGDKVPSGVMNQFRALGLDPANPSNQKAIFTIESADKLLKVINDHVGADQATNRALSELRSAVKNAVLQADSTGGPFAPAVAAAARRFQLHEAVPALQAAADGSVPADSFVRRFILNGNTEEVNRLAQVLSKTDPDAFNQARAQIGSELQRAAFGENLAGDKTGAAERFAKALRGFGSDKLGAFFSADEIGQMNKLARVMAYIGSTPSNAPVNYSNTAGALIGLLKHIPGVPATVSLANAAKTTINNSRNVASSVAADIPTTPVDNISLDVRNKLARILAGGGFLGASTAAGSVRK